MLHVTPCFALTDEEIAEIKHQANVFTAQELADAAHKALLESRTIFYTKDKHSWAQKKDLMEKKYAIIQEILDNKIDKDLPIGSLSPKDIRIKLHEKTKNKVRNFLEKTKKLIALTQKKIDNTLPRTSSESDEEQTPGPLISPSDSNKTPDTSYHFAQVGLDNLGNTCYFNAGLQPLLHLKQFANAPISKNASPMTRLFMALYMKTQAAKAYDTLKPTDFYDHVWQTLFEPIGFKKFGQEDCHEFLTPMLNNLHDAGLQMMSFKNTTRRTCSVCQQIRSEVPENQKMLSLPIPAGLQNPSIDSLLQNYFAPQILKKVCDNCHPDSEIVAKKEELKTTIRTEFGLASDTVLAIKHNPNDPIEKAYRTYSKRTEVYTASLAADCEEKMALVTLPDVLVLHLKRFGFDGINNHPTKLFTQVTIPLAINIEQFASQQTDSAPYALHGIVYHAGATATFGHYTSAVWNAEEQAWYDFNDESVTKLTKAPLIESHKNKGIPYILFYVRTR